MDNQKLDISKNNLPNKEKWMKKYYLHVISQEEPILIDEEQMKSIVNFMEQGKKFVTIGEYVIMVNSIQLIEPRYAPDNIPPRPDDYFDRDKNMDSININEKQQQEWDSLFEKRRLS